MTADAAPRPQVSLRRCAALLFLLAATAVPRVGAAGDAGAFRAVRRLTVPADGRGFGTALAVAGDRLVVGAPNLGPGETHAHAFVFDPGTGALVHDLAVDVGDETWWQFSVDALGA